MWTGPSWPWGRVHLGEGDSCSHAQPHKLRDGNTFYLTTFAAELQETIFHFLSSALKLYSYFCIPENAPQFPVIRYYWRVVSEKELAVRTRTFRKGPSCHGREHLSQGSFSSLQAGSCRRVMWNASLKPALLRGVSPCLWQCDSLACDLEFLPCSWRATVSIIKNNSSHCPPALDLIIVLCMYVSKYHMYPINMYKDYVSIKEQIKIPIFKRKHECNF